MGYSGEPFGFRAALTALFADQRVRRLDWNGQGMYIYLVRESSAWPRRAHIDMQYADGTFGVWVPSISDILAEDWVIVTE